MPQGNAIDGLLAAEMSGPDKLKALLQARGHTYQSWGGERGFWPQQVQFTITGRRPYPEIRDALAADLGLTRDEIDRLIDGVEAEAA